MKKWLAGIVFILIVGIAFLATRAFYQSQKKAQVAPPPDTENLFATLSLSPAQEQKIALLENRFNNVCQTLCREMDVRRMRLSQEILKPDFDPHAADALIDEIAHYQREMEKITIRHIIEVKKFLPPQQQEELLSRVSSELKEMCCPKGECQFRRRMGHRPNNPYEEEKQK